MKSVIVSSRISSLLIVLGISSGMICLSQVSLDSASSQESDTKPAVTPNPAAKVEEALQKARDRAEEIEKKSQAAKQAAADELAARRAASAESVKNAQAADRAEADRLAIAKAEELRKKTEAEKLAQNQPPAEPPIAPIDPRNPISPIDPIDPGIFRPQPPLPIPVKTPVKLALQDIASFSCSESEPATAAKTKSSNNAPVILWKSAIFKDYSPKTRCAHVSTRFEAYRKILVEGKTPLFITSGKLNKNPVICLTTQEKEGCEEGKLPNNGLLFTLAPPEEATATQLVENLGTLLADLRQGKTVQPLES